MALPTFAAERRLLRSAGARRCRPICPARGALSSKLAARRSGCRTMGQTDGRTDGRTSDRYVEPAAHTVRAVAMIVLSSDSRGGGVAVILACVSIIVGRENSDKHGRNNTIQSPSSCLV